MAYLSRLDPVQQKEFEKLAKKGTAPADLAKHFELAVSTVHNYKKELRESGVALPDVRGQRPTGTVATGSGEIIHAPHHGSRNTSHQPIPRSEDNRRNASTSSGDLVFVVNGVSITIDGSPTSVKIGKNWIEVDF